MSRPRIHAPGQEPTAADRQRASRRARLAKGGKAVHVVLTAEEAQALEALRDREQLASDRDAIGWALTTLLGQKRPS